MWGRVRPGKGQSGNRARGGLGSILTGMAAIVGLSAPGRAGDSPDAKKTTDQAPAIVLELPHPGVLLDRLTDPTIQRSLDLVPQYRKFREGPQYRQLQGVAGVVASRLGTTWEEALRDVLGGGIVAKVFAEPGSMPRFEAIITARDPKRLEKANEVFLDLARQDAKDKKKPEPVQTCDYHGTVVHQLGDGKTTHLAYAIAPGRLVLASSSKDLERILDRLKSDKTPPAPTSGDDEATVLRGHVDLDRLRAIDPKKYTLPEKPDTGLVFLFGSWIETLRKARAVDLDVRWSETRFSARLDVPLPKDGRPASVAGFLPGKAEGAAPPIRPPGTIATVSLWRDWATIWESRADLFKPEVVQGFAQLDTLAGQFFGGREFGEDVLGAFDPHWRLVVVHQDYDALKPAPDQKLPAFALIAELDGAREDFAARLKIAFQSIIGISNVEAAQSNRPALELGSEEVDGVKIATSHFMVPGGGLPANEPVPSRYNYSVSEAQVGRYFVLSSTTALARTLVRELKDAKEAGKDRPATFTVEADGPEVAQLLEQNRSRMVMQTMLGQGQTKQAAEDRVASILAWFRYLGHGKLAITDAPDRTHAELTLDLSR